MKIPVLGVVPVRLESARLPQKPLHPILGRPLLEWVWRRVAPMRIFEKLVVATDSSAIRELCERLGAPVVMTDPDHESGTDRVAEVVERPEFREFTLVVNVQGDEPLVEENHLSQALALIHREGWEVGTCATPLRTHEAWLDPSVVKVARGRSGRALYFSRAAIPFVREGASGSGAPGSDAPGSEQLSETPFLRHLGIYAYHREALVRWVSLSPSPLERLEKLEQLRALEDGIEIGVVVVDRALPGVDTAADAVNMEALLSELSSSIT